MLSPKNESQTLKFSNFPLNEHYAHIYTHTNDCIRRFYVERCSKEDAIAYLKSISMEYTRLQNPSSKLEARDTFERCFFYYVIQRDSCGLNEISQLENHMVDHCIRSPRNDICIRTLKGRAFR